MSITAEQVTEARSEAAEAADESRSAHEAADQADLEASQARLDAETARADADRLDAQADNLETEAGQREGVATASGERCAAARERRNRAEAEAAGEEARARRIQERNPGVCNDETTAADERAAAARGRADSARADAESICAEASADQAAATEARRKATAAREEAEQAQEQADTLESAVSGAESAAVDRRAEAVAAALRASLIHDRAEQLAADFELQSASMATLTCRPPSTDDGSAAANAPPAPRGAPGVHADTEANYTIGAKRGIFLFEGLSYEKVDGKYVEITVGNKITNVLAAEGSIVVGAKLEEVFGLELKLVIRNDLRKIIGSRWERNVGFKGETVRGKAVEWTMASHEQLVPTANCEKNPTKKLEAEKKVESKAVEILEQHKTKLADTRDKIKLNYQKSHEFCKSVTSKFDKYKEDVGKIEANVKDMIQKLSTLKTEAAKYQNKSDGFIKVLSEGAVVIKAANFKGKADSKYHVCAQVIAEIQGQVKWN